MAVGDGQPVAGAVDLPDSTSALTVTVRDSSGQVVRTLPLGANAKGEAPFMWDGMTDTGGVSPAGTYTFDAEFRSGSTVETGTTLLVASIDSVKLGTDGFSVELRGIGEKPFSSVKQIGN